MFIDQLLDLYRAGVLRRRVYDSLPLERLLASGAIHERIDEQHARSAAGRGRRAAARPAASSGAADATACSAATSSSPTAACAQPMATWIAADLGDAAARTRSSRPSASAASCRTGRCCTRASSSARAASTLRCVTCRRATAAQFGMRGVAYVNQLYGPDQELRILQRRDARFVNTTMMVTLLGAAVSDGLADGRVVSGVGGQYNFVSMAHALPGARSILCVRATRIQRRAQLTSNIVWNYAHITIPRHLRDIVVTEYGVADLRGRTDQEDHRGAAEHRRLALSGAAARAGQGGAQDSGGLSHPGCISGQHAGAPACVRLAEHRRRASSVSIRSART